ncbi:MAG: hypothetical protein IJZ73_06620 [Clostridia bacterium]|nr:hypothetical protein [Clostridia bacterium]
MKKVLVFLVSIFIVFSQLTACSKWETNREEIRSEFSQYQSENDFALFFPYDKICYGNNELSLEQIIEEGYPRHVCSIKDNKIIFVTAGDSFCVYECGLQGEELRLLFKKGNLPVLIDSKVNGDIVYLSYQQGEENKVDSYNLTTGDYVTEGLGANCKISDFMPTYNDRYIANIMSTSNKKTSKNIEITDTQTQQTKFITKESLQTTIYANSLNRFGFNLRRVDILEGRIFITCSLNVWLNESEHLVFEFDFERESFKFKALGFYHSLTMVEYAC